MGEIVDFATQQTAHARHRTVEDTAPTVAVVVPTLNEASNIAGLVDALDAVLASYRAEIIFVDDWSTDGTAELLEALAARRSDIRLIRRPNRHGLASAVIEGILATAAPIVAIIDADLQHDERILPAMIDAVAASGVDIAIGSRYHADGSCGDWSGHRQQASRLATRLARSAVGVAIADPLSGFFVLRRGIVTGLAPRLSGSGFKLLLDILASTAGSVTVREFPYVFRNRTAGVSKLSAGVAYDYARLLLVQGTRRLLRHRLTMFGLVGLVGVGVNLFVLRAALGHFSFAAAQALGVAAAIACNFLLNNATTYRDRRLRGVRLVAGLISFYLVCGLGALANIGIGAALFSADNRWWLASLAGAVVGSGWNFLASSTLTWRREPPPGEAERRS